MSGVVSSADTNKSPINKAQKLHSYFFKAIYNEGSCLLVVQANDDKQSKSHSEGDHCRGRSAHGRVGGSSCFGYCACGLTRNFLVHLFKHYSVPVHHTGEHAA